MYRPCFGVFWGARAVTFGEFENQTQEFLEGLRQISPVFASWYVLGNRMNDEKLIAPDWENFDSLMLERGWDRKTPKDWFSSLDSQACPTVDSLVSVGWGCSFVTEPEAKKTSNYVHASIHDGGEMPNSSILAVSDPASPLLDPVVSERLFRYLIRFWSPVRGLVTEQSYRDAVDGAEQLGWLNYQSDPAFVQFLPVGVEYEEFNGGVLFRIGNNRVLNANDALEVRLGQEIQQNILAVED